MAASARRDLSDNRGIILFVTLALLGLLMTVGVGALVSVQNEFRVSANVTSGTSAFYLADSGIEWAKEQLGNAATNPPVLENRTQNFLSGSFAVAFSAPARVAPLSARVVARSVGSLGNSSQAVRAQLTKVYDLADAAVALRGNGRGASFSTDSFLISGKDFDPETRALLPNAKSQLGISLASDSMAADVANGLSDVQRRNVIGGSPDRAAIAASDRMAGPMVARLAEDLCNSPTAHVAAMLASNSLSFADQTWGTRAAPEIRCVRGLAESGDSVIVGANVRGVGILVVQDAEVVAIGPLYWEGLVLVTGSNVGFRAEGTESKEVFGALLINETGPLGESGPALFDVSGPVQIVFSRPALLKAADLVPPAALARSYQFLPYTLTQDYWRTETP